MESSARTVLDAMDGPLAAGFREAEMMLRMPVARRTDGYVRLSRRSNPVVEHGHYLITVLDRQCAAGTEVDLDVYGDQRVATSEYLSWIGHVAYLMQTKRLLSLRALIASED
jgi:hypothetical protein